ncbi:IS1096 element passenger TnpR family protein [Pseudomonas paeninsulae]|uniref:IS1096 element passenger TnpR family protein n=1 Tax=Pseudomonas paeninsulae TaxID=3110772 RepID=UPI002D793C1A|nr:hypothetical protein [Pseudomonas sp. IT1137]
MKVELIFNIHEEVDLWKGVIEIDSSSTLEDFHFAIQDAVEFDDDHLYEFYVSKTVRGRNRVTFDDENEKIYEVTLDGLFPLDKGHGLYYMFDYGDSWLFKITKSRKHPRHSSEGIEYPRLVSESGRRPEQYLVENW